MKRLLTLPFRPIKREFDKRYVKREELEQFGELLARTAEVVADLALLSADQDLAVKEIEQVLDLSTPEGQLMHYINNNISMN